MKKLEIACMIVAGVCTSVSIVSNWSNGWMAIAWQVCTLLWIGTCWIKTYNN